jgi:hypothetical protein
MVPTWITNRHLPRLDEGFNLQSEHRRLLGTIDYIFLHTPIRRDLILMVSISAGSAAVSEREKVIITRDLEVSDAPRCKVQLKLNERSTRYP